MGNVYGHKMYRGCGCHFLEKKCTIYEERPEEPCRGYSCEWLTNDTFPGWLKPNVSGIIVSKRGIKIPTLEGMKEIEYYDAIETSGKIDSSVLNWLFQWSAEKQVNFAYEVDGKMYFVGDEEFKNFALRNV